MARHRLEELQQLRRAYREAWKQSDYQNDEAWMLEWVVDLVIAEHVKLPMSSIGHGIGRVRSRARIMVKEGHVDALMAEKEGKAE